MASESISSGSTHNTKRVRMLKNKQSAFKIQISNLSKYLETFQESEIEIMKLRERVERIRKQFDHFNDVQDELGLINNVEETESIRTTVTDDYDNVLITAMMILERADASATHTTNENHTHTMTTSSISLNQINLPKIDLPKFDGHIEKWITFKDAFTNMIHKYPGLSNVQKLNYLRLSLSGKAIDAIDAFMISEDNYEVAWKHLNEMYDNKRVLILRHAALIRDTPAMKNNSSESIRDLVSYMQLHVRSLQALGRSWEDIGSDLLTSIVISKMSKDTRKGWEATLTTTEMPKITDVFKHLHMAAHQCKEYDTEQSDVSNSNSDKHVYHEKNKIMDTRYHKFLKSEKKRTNSSQSRDLLPLKRQKTRVFATTSNFQCRICNTGSHPIYACKKFSSLPVDKRVEAAERAQVCLNCLRPGHRSENCKAGRCRVCGKLHNTRLHQESSSSSEKSA